MQKTINVVLGSASSIHNIKWILFLCEISTNDYLFFLISFKIWKIKGVLILVIILPRVNVSVSLFARAIWFSIVDKGDSCNHSRLANFHNQGHHSQRRPGCPAIVSKLIGKLCDYQRREKRLRRLLIESCSTSYMEEFASQPIDITGTKGKSTTSSLLYKVLFVELF